MSNERDRDRDRAEANSIDRYLNEVCWALDAPLDEAQAVRDELRAHIEDAAREAELAGSPREPAIDAALAALGDPTDVGRAMRGSRGTTPLRRPLVQRDGALAFGLHRPHAMPRPVVLLALGAAALMSAIVGIAYAWPS